MPGAKVTVALPSALLAEPPACGVTTPTPDPDDAEAVTDRLAGPPSVHSW